MRIRPEASLSGLSGSLRFSPFPAKPCLAILGIDPRKASLNQIPIEIADYPDDTVIAVAAKLFNIHNLASDLIPGEVGCDCSKSLSSLRAVNPVKTDADLLIVLRQNGYSIAVSNLYDFTRKGIGRSCKNQEEGN